MFRFASWKKETNFCWYFHFEINLNSDSHLSKQTSNLYLSTKYLNQLMVYSWRVQRKCNQCEYSYTLIKLGAVVQFWELHWRSALLWKEHVRLTAKTVETVMLELPLKKSPSILLVPHRETPLPGNVVGKQISLAFLLHCITDSILL